MRRPAWLGDSISRRFAVAIAASAAVCVTLNIVADAVIGGPAFSPPDGARLLDDVAAIVHKLDDAPAGRRSALAAAQATRGVGVAWSAAADTEPGAVAADLHAGDGTSSARLVVRLRDGGSVIFTPAPPDWSPRQPSQWLLRVFILVFSIMAVALAGADRLARPIGAFADAARRFGADPNAPPMTPRGPAEMRAAMTAFNAMQSQIQRFVAGQAAMFAAISHDLRTPLTRMRLRGEFIEDADQQRRLFRDIDEMQSMISAVLTFLRDNAADEQTTSLDLAELLRSIADDFTDLGADVTYGGLPHLAFPGRPVGLRRGFTNLVDNAVKYGGRARVDLRRTGEAVTVTVTDQGPGLPAGSREAVFTPFHRLEPSRNRNTGGMGLGLTAARACFRAHGGDVTLANTADAGLCATVVLPLPSAG